MWFCDVGSAPPPRITAALADAERFADGDLDVIHGIAVPELPKIELEKRNIKMFATVSLPR